VTWEYIEGNFLLFNYLLILQEKFLFNYLLSIMEYFKLYNAGQQVPVFSTSPIWMLGHCYQCENDIPSSSSSSSPVSSPSFPSFVEAFSRLLWFTYRKDFSSIENTQFTSDAGWGCMLRSGQMILAQALIANSENSDKDKEQIVRWFADTPRKESPYSIHAIAKSGELFGKAIGEWFGPSTIANVLCELVGAHKSSNLCVYVSDDGAVYVDKVTKLATSNGNTWRPVLIIVPLRLGLDTMNEIYYPSILEMFRFPQSLGIIGGKPRASLYFVAAQDDFVFYLDPHTLQPTVNVDPKFDTYHCAAPKRAHVSEIDPSLALAFYCRNKEQFDDFCDKSHQANTKDATLYTVSSNAPDYGGSSSILLEGEEEDIDMDMDMIVL